MTQFADMKRPDRVRLIAAICLLLNFSPTARTQDQTAMHDSTKEKVVASHASGAFEVKLVPQSGDEVDLGRMSIDKQFHGDLEGSSKGQMLSAISSSVKGSGGYVALERVTATLKGRSGAFVLQHLGTMTRGTPQLSVTVVPDSGTGRLAGLTGTLTIKNDNGKHSYEFDYTLPEVP